jgi:hypothetical protein
MYDINITVNGSRCKQYHHQGKTFIEAKQGSEYVIEIKNNSWKRILAVSAVDGLNVLTGKTANEADSGYIIPSYSAEKIKGFRFSDDEWAMFKFGFKYDGKTYAQSKQDGSEKNCGVIGIRLFGEKEVPPAQIITHWNSQPYYSPTPDWIYHPFIYGDNSGDITYMNNINYCADMGAVNNTVKTTLSYSSNNASEASLRSLGGKGMSTGTVTACAAAPQAKGFDMGTEWGRREKSKVHTVSFERGVLNHSVDIYYASRESLIEMGVPLTNELQVNLPQSFPEKYAKPPTHWNG